MASINEKLNYINGTKSLIKDKLNDLGSEITNQTTFRDYADRIEDLYEEWPKVNNEGTNITLNNTKKGKIDLELKGDIYQFTTTGKNKAQYNEIKNLPAYATTIYPTDNGEKKKWFDNINNLPKDVELISNWNYSGDGDSVENITGKRVSVYYTDDSYQITQKGTSFIIPSSKTIKFIIVYGNQNGTSNIWSDIQIEPGSTITNYEPYTGGIASPNPDYPQQIHTTTGDNVISVCGINIWDEQWESGNLNYSTGAIEPDNTRIRSKNYIPVIPNTIYYLFGGQSAGRECFYDKNKNHISSTSVYNNTFTTPNNAYYMKFTTGSGYGSTYNNDICINVSNSNINGNYYPYDRNTYPLTLGTLEYSKMENYEDEFIYNTTNTNLQLNKWYLKKNLPKYVFTGNENWTTSPYGTNSWSVSVINTNYDINKKQVICEVFNGIPASERDEETNTIYSSSNTIITIRNTTLTTKEQVQNATIGKALYYATVNPEYLPLNDTLQEQLTNIYNNMMSKKGTTNISQVNDDLPMVISAIALMKNGD